MKITTLVAAAALATASTAAVADTANVTTDSGEIVMIVKNQSAPFAGSLGTGTIVLGLLAALVGAAGAGTGS